MLLRKWTTPKHRTVRFSRNVAVQEFKSTTRLVNLIQFSCTRCSWQSNTGLLEHGKAGGILRALTAARTLRHISLITYPYYYFNYKVKFAPLSRQSITESWIKAIAACHVNTPSSNSAGMKNHLDMSITRAPSNWDAYQQSPHILLVKILLNDAQIIAISRRVHAKEPADIVLGLEEPWCLYLGKN
jgi:hypothetical protein